ncbi:MAG: hypothetical protein U5L76_01440 [Patescibacteria group bacterium]|nr:hypothetical protein [Patescibacteria group bacterium]
MINKKNRPPMYSYCDYRCEKCWYSWYKKYCPIYKKDKKRVIKHKLGGEDPYDLKNIFKDIKEDFKKSKNLLYKNAKKWEINLNKKDTVKQIPKPNSNHLKLYYKTKKYFNLVHNYFEEWEDKIIKPKLAEEIGNISCYHSLIAVKLFRTLNSLWESRFENEGENEISLKDAYYSGEIVLRGINISINSWKEIYKVIKDDRIIEFLGRLKAIEKEIKDKFKIKRILSCEEMYLSLEKYFNH